ncbi:MAG: hypothetical protein M0P58_11615 [Bacteroidales bacterium]|nr:hypothetical protein [Bacteroidales bacterium]
MNGEKLISDYYPLKKDISEWFIRNELPKYFTTSHDENLILEVIIDNLNAGIHQNAIDAEYLVIQAWQNKLSAFQAMVLLIKRAFEGHVNLTRDLKPSELFEQGTYLLDLTKDTSLSLVYDFFDQIPLYFEGLRLEWAHLLSKYDLDKSICFDSSLYFVLTNQLFKFPVSTLGEYNILNFMNFTESQKKFYRHQYEFSTVIMQFLGDYYLINTVNAIYYERFRGVAITIRSKEEVLSQLDIKLIMANDPAIQSEKELERKYFEFLVATRIKNNQPLDFIMSFKINSDAGEEIAQQFTLSRLKQLYRAISKNCSETHTSMDREDTLPELKNLFIDANRIYNEIKSDECDYFIHYNMLIHLFNQTICLS